jgi:hypothetical protein
VTVERPSALTFLTGWTVQNVATTDAGAAEALAQACIADAGERGLSGAELMEAAGGDMVDFMRSEIARFAAAAPERDLSRDD